MFEQMNDGYSKVLDEIMEARFSVRAFSDAVPDKKDIEQIISAGLNTPFAGKPARGKSDFRRVFIIRTNSDVMKSVETILLAEISKLSNEMLGKPEGELPDNTTYYFRNAPYLIIAAERKGYPITYMSDHSISLSYCMYGMWLKATTLKIGFKLTSAFIHAKLGNHEEFCQLISLPCSEYALDACVVGYPHDKLKPPQANHPANGTNVHWL
jgi:hypothetical protein